MCGRFSRWIGIEILLERFRPIVEAEYTKSYNVAPRTTNPVLRGSDGVFLLSGMEWGLDMGKNRPINARAENLDTPMYREAFLSRRAVVPVSGFYEWKDGRPYHITTGDMMTLGAIYNEIDGHRSFAIITVEANEQMSYLHSRMPLILEDIDHWFGEHPPYKLVQPFDGSLDFTEVSTYVNNPRNDSVECIRPVSQTSLEDFFG